MIRINLLPAKAGRTKSKGPAKANEAFGGILIGVVTACMLFGYVSWEDEKEALLLASGAVARETRALGELKRKGDKDGASAEDGTPEDVKSLRRETHYFDRLMPLRKGHLNLLQYIAYTLTPIEDSKANRDELISQQKAGWKSRVDRAEEELHGSLGGDERKINTKCQRLTDRHCWEPWRPAFIWPTKVSIKEKKITVEGLARSHEYVAEFYGRLKTGIYLLDLRPISQQIVLDEVFQDRELVAFKVEALFNPLSLFRKEALAKMELHMASGEVPSQLKHRIIQEKVPDPPKGKKGKKGKKKGKKGH